MVRALAAALQDALEEGLDAVVCDATAPGDLDDRGGPADRDSSKLEVGDVITAVGLGRSLVEEALERGRQLDYACVLLDTLSDMEAARALYDDLGFEEIPPYYFNPIAGAHYLKAEL